MIFVKKAIAFSLTLLILFVTSINVIAHQMILDINYDSCVPVTYSDGEDEMWYILHTPERRNLLS